MKTVAIRELHEATGRLVREAQKQTLVITDRGVKIAILTAYSEDKLPGIAFPRRVPNQLPRVESDSTEAISADRDGR